MPSSGEKAPARHPGDSVRPEWLFEVVNRLQPIVGAPQNREGLGRAVFDAFPPTSPFENAVREELLRRLSTDNAGFPIPDAEGSIYTQPTRLEVCQKAVEMAQRMINTNVAAPWTIDRVARTVGLNRTDLESSFVRCTSVTVHTFVVLSRVYAAKTLLRDTAWRVEEISKAVGYRSKVSLYKQFRRVEGTTPDGYRQRWLPVSPSKRLQHLFRSVL